MIRLNKVETMKYFKHINKILPPLNKKCGLTKCARKYIQIYHTNTFFVNDINRLIDLPPHSRNEGMAQLMLQLNMCERRGSGYDRAVAAIEEMLLPAYKVQSGEDYTRVSMFPMKAFKDMTKEEKIIACYQHACLLYENNLNLTNQAVRKRFGLDKNKSSVASRIIADAVERRLLKVSDEQNTSTKYVSYIPFYG